MSDLSFLTNQVEEAAGSLEEAIKSALARNLPGTAAELRSALSYARGVLHEIDCKEQAEFAPFRVSVGHTLPEDQRS